MMDHSDVRAVLTKIQIFDRRTIGKPDIIAWHAIIGELPKPLCLQAVEDHFREQPGVWLEPGHIYQRARALRRQQLDRLTQPELDALQDRIDARLADRIIEDEPDEGVETHYWRPDINPLTVPCRFCHAAIGRRCTHPAGVGKRLTFVPLTKLSGWYHRSRVDTASAAAEALPEGSTRG